MHKVELTEKEAKSLGESRWMERNRWGFILPIAGAAIAALGLLFLSAMDSIPDTVAWGGVPLLGLAIFLTFRGMDMQIKAGKAFAQSLKEEPEK